MCITKKHISTEGKRAAFLGFFSLIDVCQESTFATDRAAAENFFFPALIFYFANCTDLKNIRVNVSKGIRKTKKKKKNTLRKENALQFKGGKPNVRRRRF